MSSLLINLVAWMVHQLFHGGSDIIQYMDYNRNKFSMTITTVNLDGEPAPHIVGLGRL
jgi:hypothetical protein